MGDAMPKFHKFVITLGVILVINLASANIVVHFVKPPSNYVFGWLVGSLFAVLIWSLYIIYKIKQE
jgi:FtsH-binding integral membrane protein